MSIQYNHTNNAPLNISTTVGTLHRVQAEKEALEGALERLAERSENDRDTARREERLVLSAVYQIGTRIMDRNIAEATLDGKK